MKKSVFLILIFVILVYACKHQVVNITNGTGGGNHGGGSGGGTNDSTICFESDILAIFQSNCAQSGCHNATSHQDGYVFDSYENIVKKGINPGDANGSKVYEVMIETGDDRMPPAGNKPLTKNQTDMVAQWINEGAENTTNCGTACDETLFTYSGAVKPILDLHCTGCHNSSNSGGGVDLSIYDGTGSGNLGVKQVALNGKLVGTITWAPGFSKMPQGGDKLIDCNISQITQWVNAGAPNN